MAKTIMKRRARRPRVGDLRTRVIVQNRAITPPDENEYDFDHEFETAATVWASIETLSGETLFDQAAGQDVVVSHRVVVRWIEGVSAESWLELPDGTRLDVVSTENLEERSEFLVMLARRTGLTSDKVGQA